MPQDGGKLHQLGFTGDDAALARALKSGHPGAPAALFDRYASHVQRVLLSVLGSDPEISELVHEVFARAFTSVAGLRQDDRLKAWLTSLAVFTARGCIRARRRRRWLLFLAPENVPDPVAPSIPIEVREALGCTYRLLARLPTDQRIAFTLRRIEGMEQTRIAEACGVSLSTIKRRLVRAERRFLALARREPALRAWIDEEQGRRRPEQGRGR